MSVRCPYCQTHLNPAKRNACPICLLPLPTRPWPHNLINHRLAKQLFCITLGASAYAYHGATGTALFCVGAVIGHHIARALAR